MADKPGQCDGETKYFSTEPKRS